MHGNVKAPRGRLPRDARWPRRFRRRRAYPRRLRPIAQNARSTTAPPATASQPHGGAQGDGARDPERRQDSRRPLRTGEAPQGEGACDRGSNGRLHVFVSRRMIWTSGRALRVFQLQLEHRALRPSPTPHARPQTLARR